MFINQSIQAANLKDHYHFEVYSTKSLFRKEKWRWRFMCSDNGKIMSASTEGYADIRDAVHGIAIIARSDGCRVELPNNARL